VYSWRVPVWISGSLKIVADADLGSLGAKDSTPALVECPPVSWLALAAPGLVLLGFFGLKANRQLAAAAVFVPLGLLWSLLVLMGQVPFMASGSETLVEAINALAFGVAAVWLLAPLVDDARRARVFFSVFAVMAGASLVVFLVEKHLQLGGQEAFLMGALGVLSGLFSLSLSLAGFFCRKSNNWLLFAGCLVGFLGGVCFVSMGSIGLLNDLSPEQLLLGFLGLFAIWAGILFPFILLGAFSSFYRQRLQNLWGMRAATPSGPENGATP